MVRIHDGGEEAWQQEELRGPSSTHRKEAERARQTWCGLGRQSELGGRGVGLGGRASQVDMAWASETAEPTPSDTPPPERPRLLILLRQFYQLRAEYSNI